MILRESWFCLQQNVPLTVFVTNFVFSSFFIKSQKLTEIYKTHFLRFCLLTDLKDLWRWTITFVQFFNNWFNIDLHNNTAESQDPSEWQWVLVVMKGHSFYKTSSRGDLTKAFFPFSTYPLTTYLFVSSLGYKDRIVSHTLCRACTT